MKLLLEGRLGDDSPGMMREACRPQAIDGPVRDARQSTMGETVDVFPAGRAESVSKGAAVNHDITLRHYLSSSSSALFSVLQRLSSVSLSRRNSSASCNRGAITSRVFQPQSCRRHRSCSFVYSSWRPKLQLSI